MTTGPVTTDTAPREERRTSPRSRIAFPIELALPDAGDGAGPRAAAQVCDLSLSGIRCVTARPIGVMTQVGLLLVLPDADTAIDCRGAVVRSDRLDDGDGDGRYETAIFFTSMAEPDRVELQEFLQTVRERTEAEPDA
jgi:hypothetical protein